MPKENGDGIYFRGGDFDSAEVQTSLLSGYTMKHPGSYSPTDELRKRGAVEVLVFDASDERLLERGLRTTAAAALDANGKSIFPQLTINSVRGK